MTTGQSTAAHSRDSGEWGPGIGGRAGGRAKAGLRGNRDATASGRRLREIVSLATQAKLKVEIVPSLAELTTGRVQVSRIRPVEVVDLLGREPVPLDSALIAELVRDRVVMVTGAGGSIGGELCRQIAALNPKRLLMVEQAEGSLFQIEQELNETGLGAIALPLVADILDAQRMELHLCALQSVGGFPCRGPQACLHDGAAARRGVAQ